MNWRHVAVAQILVSVVACGKPGQNSNTRIPDSLSGVAPAEPAAAPPNERPRDSTAAIAGVREYPHLIAKMDGFEAYADRSASSGAPAILVRIAGRDSADTSISLAE